MGSKRAKGRTSSSSATEQPTSNAGSPLPAPMGAHLAVKDLELASRFYQTLGFQQQFALPRADGQLTAAAPRAAACGNAFMGGSCRRGTRAGRRRRLPGKLERHPQLPCQRRHGKTPTHSRGARVRTARRVACFPPPRWLFPRTDGTLGQAQRAASVNRPGSRSPLLCPSRIQPLLPSAKDPHRRPVTRQRPASILSGPGRMEGVFGQKWQ